MDAVQKANSGHPGTPMALAPLAYVLYTRVMRHNPRDPAVARPRPLRALVRARLDAAVLDAVPDAATTSASRTTSSSFRQLGSTAAGHPEYGHVPGVEVDDRPARAGDLARRRDGARRADARRALQPPRPRDRRPPHVRDRLRRRHRGGDLGRGVLARRPPRARPADRRSTTTTTSRSRATPSSRSPRTSAERYEALRLARPGPRGGHRARRARAGAARRRWRSRTGRR